MNQKPVRRWKTEVSTLWVSAKCCVVCSWWPEHIFNCFCSLLSLHSGCFSSWQCEDALWWGSELNTACRWLLNNEDKYKVYLNPYTKATAVAQFTCCSAIVLFFMIHVPFVILIDMARYRLKVSFIVIIQYRIAHSNAVGAQNTTHTGKVRIWINRGIIIEY